MSKTSDDALLDLRPLPHALGPEKSVLSSLLKEPGVCFPQARRLGLTEESFYFPEHILLYGELERLHGRGEEIELVSLVQRLLDRGELAAIGGPAGLTDLYTYAPSSLGFATHAGMLREKEAMRGMVRIFRDGLDAVYGEPEAAAAHLARAAEGLHGLSAIRPTGAESLRERAYSLRYDAVAAPPDDEVCLLLGDVPVAAMGNLTVVQGKSKVGKSAVVSAIIAAALAVGRAGAGDCLAFRWLHRTEGEQGAIIHLDTEQSPADWHGLVSRALVRAGLSTPPPRLISLPLVTFSRAERLTVLREALEYERDHGAGTAIVIGDGVADLCVSPNDEEEALELVSRLLALCHEFHAAHVAIIHENPSTETAKTRGHLGSELNRKAFANLRIDKDSATGVSVIYGTDMRKRDIPQTHGFCFGWDDKAGMHVYRGRNASMKAEERERDAMAKARDYWEEIFEGLEDRTNDACPELGIKQAAELASDMDQTGKPVSEATIGRRMLRAEILGVLEKTKPGIYRLKRFGPIRHGADRTDLS